MPDTGTPSIGKNPGGINGGGMHGALKVVNALKDAGHRFTWAADGDANLGMAQDTTKVGLDAGPVTVTFSKPSQHKQPKAISVNIIVDKLQTVTVKWKK